MSLKSADAVTLKQAARPWLWDHRYGKGVLSLQGRRAWASPQSSQSWKCTPRRNHSLLRTHSAVANHQAHTVSSHAGTAAGETRVTFSLCRRRLRTKWANQSQHPSLTGHWKGRSKITCKHEEGSGFKRKKKKKKPTADTDCPHVNICTGQEVKCYLQT